MTSNSSYGWDTTGTEVAQSYASSIQGKNILVTGVSPKSLGESLVPTLARHNPANLILASRSKSKINEVLKLIATNQTTQIHSVTIDLSSQSNIHKAAAKISQLVPSLDILINNAAITTSERRETAEGIELQLGVNHIGHFLLTSLLLTLLLSSPSPRVVNVSSAGYTLSPIRFQDYNFEGKSVPKEEQPPPTGVPRAFRLTEEKPYHVFIAYAQAKTANVLHAFSLNQKFGGKGLKAFAIHPGSIRTDLSRNLSPEDSKWIDGITVPWKTQDQGIATILVAALDPGLEATPEKFYLSDCQFEDVLAHAKDPNIAKRLWKLSESLTVETTAKL